MIADGQSSDKQCRDLASYCCHKEKSGRLTVKDNACFERVGYNNAFHGLQPGVAVSCSCQVSRGFRHRCLGVRLLDCVPIPLGIAHEPLMERLVQHPFQGEGYERRSGCDGHSPWVSRRPAKARVSQDRERVSENMHIPVHRG